MIEVLFATESCLFIETLLDIDPLTLTLRTEQNQIDLSKVTRLQDEVVNQPYRHGVAAQAQLFSFFGSL